MRYAKRPGFFSVYCLVWIMLASTFALLAVVRAERIAKDLDGASDGCVQRELARIGADSAEDWLISAFETGDIPRANGGPNSAYRTEAVRLADGMGFHVDDDIAALGVEVTISDTSFDITSVIEGDIESIYPIPSIPHRIGTTDGSETSSYFYYVMSRASTGKVPYRTVCGEVIRVDVDAVFGDIRDVSRLTFSQWSESP